MLVIRCGGINIPAFKRGKTGEIRAKSADLRTKLKSVLEQLATILTSTIILWSQSSMKRGV